MKSFVAFLIRVLRYFWVRIDKSRSSQQPKNAVEVLYERAAIRAAQYIESNIDAALIFNSRFSLLEYSLSRMQEEVTPNGLICEFGVWTGKTLDLISRSLESKKSCKIYGFDSFKGLREPWYGTYHAGESFKISYLPKVRKNVTLIVGFFEETLEQFLKDHPGPLLFAHIDSDTYPACKYILNAFERRMQRGTIIVFDEYHGFPNFEGGEFGAWKEFCQANKIHYEYIGFSLKQAAIRVLNIDHSKYGSA